MPLKTAIDSLRAEAKDIRELLSEAKDIGDPVGELQLTQRLEEIESKLDELGIKKDEYANVALYFGGKPVFGSQGIKADFAGKSLNSFQEIVSRIFANSELKGLGQRGRIPLKNRSELLVTGVTHGSFGFVLNEVSDQKEIYESSLKEVVNKTAEFISEITSESYSDFEEVVGNIDNRTLQSLRAFFKGLDTAGATLRLVSEKKEFTIDKNAVKRGRQRTEETQIEEKTELLKGILIGFLPEHRKFEFTIEDGETIYGSVTKEAKEQYEELIGKEVTVLKLECQIECVVREIKPLNQEKRFSYKLEEFKNIYDL